MEIKDDELKELMAKVKKEQEEWSRKYNIPDFRFFETKFEYIGDDEELKLNSNRPLVCTSMPTGKGGKKFFVFSVMYEHGFSNLHDIVIAEEDFNSSVRIIKGGNANE